MFHQATYALATEKSGGGGYVKRGKWNVSKVTRRIRRCVKKTVVVVLFPVSVKKDPNTPCEEGRIEMTKVNFVGSELHCSKLRTIRIRLQVCS